MIEDKIGNDTGTRAPELDLSTFTILGRKTLLVLKTLSQKTLFWTIPFCWGTLTFGHLGLSSQAFSASSRAAWCCPSLSRAAERLLYRMQFCGSACKASLYNRTAAWKSPRWHASLLCCTLSMNSALLRAYLAASSPGTHRIGLPTVREPKIENWRNTRRGMRGLRLAGTKSPLVLLVPFVIFLLLRVKTYVCWKHICEKQVTPDSHTLF